jgi:hypothetical protein
MPAERTTSNTVSTKTNICSFHEILYPFDIALDDATCQRCDGSITSWKINTKQMFSETLLDILNTQAVQKREDIEIFAAWNPLILRHGINLSHYSIRRNVDHRNVPNLLVVSSSSCRT